MSTLQLNDELLRKLEARDLTAVLELDQGVEISRLQQEVLKLREQIKRLSVYRFMAYRDELTGLHNRRYFDEHLKDECARASRFSDYTFALVVVDINDFKQVNDTYGHTTGDVLLCDVAHLLKDSVRRVDMCCRIGGDEFGLILPETDEAGARLLMNRLVDRLEERTTDQPYTLSVSLGYACPNGDLTEPANVLSAADEAMYASKRLYKNQKK